MLESFEKIVFKYSKNKIIQIFVELVIKEIILTRSRLCLTNSNKTEFKNIL